MNMKKRLPLSVPLLPILLLCFSFAQGQTELRGTVADAATQEPLPYATIQLQGTSYGIVSNDSGRFVLRIPPEVKADSVRINSIGYQQRTIALAAWRDQVITLQEQPIQLQDVLITTATPESLLREAIARHAENTPTQAQFYRTFYREYEIWHDKTFTNIRSTEAVMDWNRPGTARKDLKSAQFRLVKARQIGTMDDSSAQEFRDATGLKGGPYKLIDDASLEDRLEGRTFNPDHKEFGKFQRKIDGIIMREGRETFVISFAWNGEPAFRPSGKIYIDVETKAFAGYENDIPVEMRAHGPSLSLFGFGFQAQDALYAVQYRYINGKWYPYYIRGGIAVRLTAKNEKRERQFRENFKLGKEFDAWYYKELFVSDIVPVMPAPFPKEQVLREKDRMADKRGDASDAFWQGYTYVPAAGIGWLLQRN